MKRAFDVLVSAAGLAVLGPLLAAVALAVRCDSPGPVLFRHRRVGRGGRPFDMYKFRTMTDGAERRGPAITADNDARITRVGAYLRAAKLDELPQLLNVLKGDMSLVGPRPEVARYVEMFAADYEEIVSVRPGITDFASLHFSNEGEILARAASPEAEYVTRILPEKIALAKAYVRSASFATDLRLIARTVLRVASRASHRHA
jgi:lipopolysaccharide/colanic/teichoic acid biosynthesis glycosyltransferase